MFNLLPNKQNKRVDDKQNYKTIFRINRYIILKFVTIKGGDVLVTLTGFADEISPELDVQLKVLASEQINHLELRGIWNKNVLDLSDKELEESKAQMDHYGVGVSSIGSPIGKIGIRDNFELHLEKFKRAIEVAEFFGTSYIRIFSFFIPKGDDPLKYRNVVLSRMEALTRLAENHNVILLHENEKDIYGDNSERCLDIHETIQSQNLRCAFDPANFVQCGVRPFTDAYARLEKYIEYVHIKDALFENGEVVPPGEGDAEVLEVLQSLYDRGYKGFLSLEPHLSAAGTFSGFSGPDLFVVASQALKGLLTKVDESWLVKK
jgi:3-dehydroshikimate dehydratase